MSTPPKRKENDAMKASRITIICLAAALAVMNPSLASANPLKVFILAWQSSMQGQASEATLAGLAMDPATKPLYDKLVDGNGKPRGKGNVKQLDPEGKHSALREKPAPLQKELDAQP
jgi:hypothetical protein